VIKMRQVVVALMLMSASTSAAFAQVKSIPVPSSDDTLGWDFYCQGMYTEVGRQATLDNDQLSYSSAMQSKKWMQDWADWEVKFEMTDDGAAKYLPDACLKVPTPRGPGDLAFKSAWEDCQHQAGKRQDYWTDQGEQAAGKQFWDAAPFALGAQARQVIIAVRAPKLQQCDKLAAIGSQNHTVVAERKEPPRQSLDEKSALSK
jgi:hypothetical protein